MNTSGFTKKYQITSLKPCKVKPNGKNLSEEKRIQFVLTSPQKYMSYEKSLRWCIPILWTSFLKVEASKDFVNKFATWLDLLNINFLPLCWSSWV